MTFGCFVPCIVYGKWRLFQFSVLPNSSYFWNGTSVVPVYFCKITPFIRKKFIIPVCIVRRNFLGWLPWWKELSLWERRNSSGTCFKLYWKWTCHYCSMANLLRSVSCDPYGFSQQVVTTLGPRAHFPLNGLQGLWWCLQTLHFT